jgi:VanZ family protein
MAISRKQKPIIISLLIYWPTLFVLAHIPIPQLVRKAGVSDKIIHFVAYLVLVFLLWFVISPGRKVNWRRTTAWWVFFGAVCYGIFDELMQGVVAGRSCDAMDFLADLAGVLTGLILFAFFTFWPAFLVVAGITIFALTNLTRVNLADLLPTAANVAFYLFAYGFFAAIWMQNMHLLSSLRAPKIKWLIAASALPICFLAAVKLFSVAVGRDFRWQDVIIAAVGIVVVVITIYLPAFVRCRRIQASADT